MNSTIQPIASAQRIEMLDTLRGFAIFGILMVNMQIFYQPVSHMLIGYNGSENLLEKLAGYFIKFFFEGKFYVLFSMLFGYGFWLFINKQVDEGASIIPVYRRRAFFLLIFGLLHVIFLWAGDILVFYALLGFILIAFRKKKDSSLIKWSVWLALIPAILYFFGYAMFALASLHPEGKAGAEAGMQENFAETMKLYENAMSVYSSGTFAEIVSVRIGEYLALLPGMLFFYPVVLAMFLLGVWAARRGLITNYPQHLPFFRKALWWGLIAGLATNTIYVIAIQKTSMAEVSLWGFLSSLMHTIGGVSFCLVYVSAFVLLTSRGKVPVCTRFLAPVGRMALTNYLFHSIICSTIFLSYGGGLMGKINAWQGILLCIVILAVQIPISYYWLKHFNYGPFEWLWRSLTYLKFQPFSRMDITER